MFPGSVSKVSRSLSYLLIWFLAFSYHGQSAALVAERLDDRSTDPSIWAHSAAIIPRIPGEIVSRVPAATWIQDLRQKWPRVWTGQTKYQSAPDVWSRIVAQEAYNKMKAEGGTNLIAVFCIPKGSCFVASIPRDDSEEAVDFVKAQMNNCPQWKEAWGNTGTKYHAEDLAIALAVFAGSTPSFSEIDKDTKVETKAFMSIYGLYTGITADKNGAPGPRWPCTSADATGKGLPCTLVLTRLNIGFLFYLRES